MANTTNFNWETPDDTDLVKDGAAAIRTLGSSIDTSLVDLKGGTTGQVLSKATNTDMDFTWVAQDDSNAIQNAIVDAKGDLIAATANDTPARLAVGTNGQILTADSTAATGLAWATPASASSDQFYAGKNRIINGNFAVNQRNFSSSTTADYMFDRFFQAFSGGSVTSTSQTFTVGTAPVAGYEGKNYLQTVITGQSAASNYSMICQKIESVRTLANQTVTVSFWALAASGTPKISVELAQNFGTGGSPSSAVNTYVGQSTISTSWTRYSVSVALPSIAGKTLGTANDDHLRLNLYYSAGTDYNSRTNSMGTQNNTFSIWGVQVEAGSTATSFQTATGSIQGELAACQRYYWRTTPGTNPGGLGSFGTAKSTTAADFQIQNPVVMRIAPTSVDYASIVVFDTVNGFALSTMTLGGVVNGTNYMTSIEVGVTSGLTQFRPYFLYTNSATGYLGFNAEL